MIGSDGSESKNHVDFERFIGPLTFDAGEGEYHEIVFYPSQRLRNLAAVQDSTGTPAMYTLEPLSFDGSDEQCWELVLHPTPGAAYTLVGQIQIGARMLSESYPYPPGGPVHGELYIASVLAAAEAKLDDENNGQKQAAFMARLMADISIDMQRQPTTLGYCGNGLGPGLVQRPLRARLVLRQPRRRVPDGSRPSARAG